MIKSVLFVYIEQPIPLLPVLVIEHVSNWPDESRVDYIKRRERRRAAPDAERLRVSASSASTPPSSALLKGERLDDAREDLKSAYPAARAAWQLGNERRRSNSFDEPTFSTSIEWQAYTTSDVETWDRAHTDEERWLRVWIYLCDLRRVGRPAALAIAGIKEGSYERSVSRRCGEDARVQSALLSELLVERERVASLSADHDYFRERANDLGIAAIVVEQAEEKAWTAIDPSLPALVKDLSRWRRRLREGNRQHRAMRRELIELREQRLRMIFENIKRFQLMRDKRESVSGVTG